MPGVPLPDDFSDPARFGPPAGQPTGSPAGQPTGPPAESPAGASAIRCPACRREHLYEPPSLPCPCGAQLRVPLLRGGVPVQVRFRSWEDSWLSMRCPHCGRNDQWPQPEFTCNCGATVRLPVDRAPRLQSSVPLGHLPNIPYSHGPQSSRPYGARPYTGSAPTVPTQGQRQSRSPFRPHPVHSSEDAVLAAARYLQWLGFDDLELTEDQDSDGVTLLGGRVVAQVNAGPEAADIKAIECLWLQTLHAEEVVAAMFTLAGYSHQATVRGEQLLVALFQLDRGGIPQPANGAAEALMETGWTS